MRFIPPMRFIPLGVLAATAMLQLQTPALTGSVLDAADRPVPGATVRISGAGVSASVVSDAMGRFRIGDLADGPYVLSVSLAGFRTQTLNVQVDSSANPELVVKLTQGSYPRCCGSSRNLQTRIEWQR
jgi:hypothetical protein